MKTKKFEKAAEDAIIKCLQSVPFLTIMEIDVDSNLLDLRPDIQLTLKIKNKIKPIIVETKSNGEPRLARQAINQLIRYLELRPDAYGIFVAPYISPKSDAICQKAGIGTIDLAGNCNILFDTVYIHRQGNPNPFTRKKYLRSLYTPKAERILRVLLFAGPKEWKTEELASIANVSIGQVANVKKLLNDQEWIVSKKIGFSLTDPMALLEDWSENYIFRRNAVLNFYSMLGPSEFEFQLGRTCQERNISYGLTGLSGSSRYAPAVRYQRVMAYVQGNINAVAESLAIKPVESGFNVTLLEPYDEGVLFGLDDIENSRVVSPIQVFLDLKSLRGRGEEAADMLLEKVIQKIWSSG